MGGILSNEEKAARAKSYRKGTQQTIGVPWDPHGYRYREHRAKGHRSRTRGQGRTEEAQEAREGRENRIFRHRTRSQSLDAILEELYLSETEGDNKGSLIPRARLNAKRGVEAKIQARRSISHFGSDSTSLHAIHMEVEKKSFERSHSNLRASISLPFLDQSDWVGNMETDQHSLGPPSYSKDFDACMKQLEDIQHNMQDQSIIEDKIIPTKQDINDLNGSPESMIIPRGKLVKRQMTPTADSAILPPDDEGSESDHDGKSQSQTDRQEKWPEESAIETTIEPILATHQQHKILIIEPDVPDKMETESFKKPSPRGWYCNLKDQFERLDKELGNRVNNQDLSCRIMGATLKNSKSTSHVEEDQGSQRKHYFSQLVRSNKSLIDEELPDPDKVQNIRAMFQEQHTRLGGSLQNISTTKLLDLNSERPKSALGNRKDDELRSLTPDSVDGERLIHRDNSTVRGLLREKHIERAPRARWTDSGSMSSGVSSDLSSCETDQESYTRETGDGSSEDEMDFVDKHYIQNEILEKIRAFGTSVTYFGGQMIRCSVGPLVSPTTQAILEEIGQKQPNGVPSTRSFDEFYKKYKETTKKRKVGRTRSFVEEEFQKTNVFNNNELEQHKTELETAFGIRRPKGKQEVNGKPRLGISYSLDSRLKNFEKTIPSMKTIVSKPSGEGKEEETEKKQEVQTQEFATGFVKKNQTKSEYFDYNARVRQQKIDMDFEEFEICESLSGREKKIAEKKELLTQDLTQKTIETLLENENNNKEELSIIKDEGKTPKPSEIKLEDSNESIINVTIRSSVQEKRNSWEEAIQQKKLNNEINMGEKRDGKVIDSKRNSVDESVSNRSSRRSSSTEDIIKHFETKIRKESLTNFIKPERHSSECSSESTNSIDYKDETKNSNSNQNTWKRQAQLRRKSIEESNRDDFETLNQIEETNGGTWKRFVENRRHSSMENLTWSRRNSIESQTSSRRSSVKKLLPFYDDKVCREEINHSFDQRSSSLTRGLRGSKKLSYTGSNQCLQRNPSENSLNKIEISYKSEINGKFKRNSIGRKSDNAEKNVIKDVDSKRESNPIERRNSYDGFKEKKRNSVKIQTNNNVEIESNETGLKKLEDKENSSKGNIHNSKKDQTEYKITIKISQTENESFQIGNDKFEEIVINDQDPMDSLELFYLKSGETENPLEMPIKETSKSKENESLDKDSGFELKKKFDKHRNYKHQSRWPVETTVVVDMEKNNEVIPKLISQGKSHVKTTKRLF